MTKEAARKYYDTMLVIGAQNAILDEEGDEASGRHLEILREAHQTARTIATDAALPELAAIHTDCINSINEELRELEA